MLFFVRIFTLRSRFFCQHAIKNGGLSLFEGKVEFEPEDLEELKTLLKYNLPIKEATSSYSVLTEEPTPQGEDADEK